MARRTELALALLVSLPALLGGCATLFSTDRQPVEFTSAPQGAEVLVDGRSVGRTPVVAPVERKTGGTVVTVRKAGFETKQFRLGTTINAVAILNLSSLLSWATDYTSGNLIEYAPNAYFVELGGASRRPPQARARLRALRYVLVSRHQILSDVSRRSGEHLQVLAGLFGVPAEAYRRFAGALAEEAPALVALEQRPHELFRTLVAVLDERGLVGWRERALAGR